MMQQYKWNAATTPRVQPRSSSGRASSSRKLELRGDESLLDIGCGDGKVTAEIAACLPQGSVVGRGQLGRA